ncbi:alpha/beta hydrolase fold domain-containing protein [Rhodovulum sulfidophilum]|nr:alpha/beta hydrolase fold domain-containing protein [Rhodovulum sulfidophilum]MBL3551121.1 alpha/beta hydrolase fold domain-containing protein [Rhodovulum sulfidophilum]OLS47659.1 alpha/beta hydrolase [Rhodovulum sulfidophilum]
MVMQAETVDWDDAYANAPHIPDSETYPARLTAAAEAFRAVAPGELDCPYGEHPRQRFDLFLPEAEPKGLMVFVHGGYWMRFDKSFWSHMAAAALARGFAAVLPSYRLAPEVTIPEITADIRAAVAAAAARVPEGPLVLAGHSAGGHLVARMLCADAAPGAAVDRIARVMPISLISDLRPLLKTQMAGPLGLDADSAAAESPALMAPRADVPVHVWVGADERPAFVDQARWLAEAWTGAALTVDPGHHHFNVIDGLAQADSPLATALFDGL